MRFVDSWTFFSNGSGSLGSKGKSPESPLSIFSRVIQFHENPSVSSIFAKGVGQQVPTQWILLAGILTPLAVPTVTQGKKLVPSRALVKHMSVTPQQSGEGEKSPYLEGIPLVNSTYMRMKWQESPTHRVLYITIFLTLVVVTHSHTYCEFIARF